MAAKKNTTRASVASASVASIIPSFLYFGFSQRTLNSDLQYLPLNEPEASVFRSSACQLVSLRLMHLRYLLLHNKLHRDQTAFSEATMHLCQPRPH